jgi:uncharacterized membrane protein
MTRRWIMIAFAVSVGLNLFLLGIAAARFWQHRQWRSERWGEAALSSSAGPNAPGRPEGGWGPRRGRADPLSWLSPPEREELRSQRQALTGTRRNAEQVLVAEPFDAAQLRSALEALRAQTAQMQSAVHQRLVQRAETLSAEERRKLAEKSWGTPGERGRPPARHRD